jgi:acetyl esterase/lipase
MPLSYTTIPIESPFGVTIQNTLAVQEPSSGKLMVLLPGRGYLNEHPVMHYTRMIGLQLGYDVLSLRYGFHLTGEDIVTERLPDVHQDAVNAITAALERSYRELCIVGKSMGTPIAAVHAASLKILRLSLILHTPVRNAVDMVGEIPTLAVIGTGDALYDPAKAVDKSNVRWLVLDGLNHGLEKPGDWQASLRALHDISLAVDAFLRSLYDTDSSGNPG